jgi:cytochrome c-type biogenesis protein CcmH/NrfG
VARVTRTARTVVLAAIALGVALAAVVVALQSPAARSHRHWRQAEAFLQAKRYAEAVIALQNIVQTDPSSAQAYLQLGRAYLPLHKYHEAFQAFSQAATLNPDLLEAQFKVGQFLLLAGKFDQARDKAQVIVSKEPAHIAGSLLLARSYVGGGGRIGPCGRELASTDPAAPGPG